MDNYNENIDNAVNNVKDGLQDVQNNLNEMKGKVSNQAIGLKDKLTEQTAEMKNKLSNQACDLKNKLNDQTRTYGNQLADSIDNARGKTSAGLRTTSERIQSLAMYVEENDARNMSKALVNSGSDYIRQNPGKTMVIGLVLGLLIGRIFSSNRNNNNV